MADLNNQFMELVEVAGADDVEKAIATLDPEKGATFEDIVAAVQTVSAADLSQFTETKQDYLQKVLDARAGGRNGGERKL